MAHGDWTANDDLQDEEETKSIERMERALALYAQELREHTLRQWNRARSEALKREKGRHEKKQQQQQQKQRTDPFKKLYRHRSIDTGCLSTEHNVNLTNTATQIMT